MEVVKGLLVAEDFARDRVDPEVLFEKVIAADDATVGEFGDSGGRSFTGHDQGSSGRSTVMEGQGRRKRGGEIQILSYGIEGQRQIRWNQGTDDDYGVTR
jgi:hypothetical protein